ncbi:hemagluttinin domain-containing protein, partial [Reticulomyxa filosa]
EYAVVIPNDDIKKIRVPIRRGRIVCELKIPLLNNKASDLASYDNGDSNGTHSTSSNSAQNASQIKVTCHDSNFEIPLSTYDPMQQSAPLMKHTLVLAESQDYLLRVVVAEVMEDNKIQLQVQSLRYMFTPPEKFVSDTNSTTTHGLKEVRTVLSSTRSTKSSDVANDLQVHGPSIDEKEQLSAETTPLTQESDDDSGVLEGGKGGRKGSKKREEERKKIQLSSNVKPRIVVNTPSNSSVRTHTPAPESVHAVPHTATEIPTNKAINNTMLLKSIPLQTITAGKTLGTSPNIINSDVFVGKTNANGMLASLQAKGSDVSNTLILPQDSHILTSPALSPFTSMISSPVHLPMTALSLSFNLFLKKKKKKKKGEFHVYGTQKFTPMNVNMHPPFMSPATMSIDHLMTQTNIATPNLLGLSQITTQNAAAMTQINSNHSPLWLLSTRTPNLPPLGSSEALCSEKNYADVCNSIGGGEGGVNHIVNSSIGTLLPGKTELMLTEFTEQSSTIDSADDNNNNISGTNDIVNMGGVAGMTTAVGPRVVMGSLNHTHCEENIGYRTDYNMPPLSTKGNGNNIMGVLTNSPTRSEKYGSGAMDKTSEFLTTPFAISDMTGTKMTGSNGRPSTRSPTHLTSMTRMNGPMDGGNLNSVNPKLLGPYLSNQPLPNLLHQWNVLPEPELSGSSRHQILTPNIMTNSGYATVGTSIGGGGGGGGASAGGTSLGGNVTHLSVAPNSHSYHNVGVTPLISNHPYGIHFQPSRGIL